MGRGVIPSQTLRRMCENGQIKATSAISMDQIQPASLDLRLGVKAYRVRASFLSGHAYSVRERLEEFKMHEVDLTQGAVLEKGCVYVVPLMESLALPKTINAVANAKSSTGRLDVFTRCIVDYGIEFDRIEAGYTGPLYAEITPRSFSILVRPGMRLNQIRFRQGQSVIGDDVLREMHDKIGLVNGLAQIDQGLGFSVDLDRPNHLVGYRAKSHTGLIDLDCLNYYNIDDFWDPLYARDKRIILDPGAFYILVSQETVLIPSDCAAEMAPYLAMVGEFRVHYAGFFDPGFGDGGVGGARSRGVLEVRCHESPFVLEHGQSVGRLIYERMIEIPDILYGAALNSNYQGQELKLSKHFKML